MTEFREAQIRKRLIGWSWRLWWRQATFITAPGWFPSDEQGRHRCEGWALTRQGAILAADRHLARHREPRSRRRQWERVDIDSSPRGNKHPLSPCEASSVQAVIESLPRWMRDELAEQPGFFTRTNPLTSEH